MVEWIVLPVVYNKQKLQRKKQSTGFNKNNFITIIYIGILLNNIIETFLYGLNIMNSELLDSILPQLKQQPEVTRKT